MTTPLNKDSLNTNVLRAILPNIPATIIIDKVFFEEKLEFVFNYPTHTAGIPTVFNVSPTVSPADLETKEQILNYIYKNDTDTPPSRILLNPLGFSKKEMVTVQLFLSKFKTELDRDPGFGNEKVGENPELLDIANRVVTTILGGFKGGRKHKMNKSNKKIKRNKKRNKSSKSNNY